MRSTAEGAPALVLNNNRRQPQRSVRSTATRPSNYYARAFGSRDAAGAVQVPETVVDSAPGFFPAITHFTDGISALPKEVTRHLTMLRETEGKAFPYEQAIDGLVDAINELPDPPRSTQPQTQAFLNFSLANSVNVSANVSVIDGNNSRPQTAMDDHTLDDPSEKRRRLFYQLRLQLQQMIHVLDEKNHVLTTANDTLARQLARLDGTMPYIEKEISEEARLGSNTHWALPHMKDLRRAAAPPPTERSRREIQAANSLAAAAAAVHEGDIAATRSEARREAMLAKRTRHANMDSDFDERNTGRKAQTSKIRKTQEALVDSVKTTSAGALASQSHKRRRIEKIVAPAMERSASTLAGRVPAGRELASPMDVPVVESVKRKPIKQPPMPAVSRKRQVAESPSIAASSPKRGTFATLNKDQSPAPTARSITASRARQDSIHSLAQDSSRGRPSNKSRMANGTPAASTELTARNVAEESVDMPEDGEVVADQVPILPPSESLKREDTEPADTALQEDRRPTATPVPLPVPMTVARSRGGSSKNSKPGTPVKTAFTDVDFPTASVAAGLARSRSTRGAANGSGSGSNSSNSNNPAAPFPALTSMAAPATKRSHKKGASGRKVSITAGSMHAPSPAPQDDKTPNSPPTSNNIGTETASATPRKTRGATTKTPVPAAEADVPPSLVSDDEEEDDDDRLSSVKDEPITAADNADETLDDDELPEVDADAEVDEDEPRYCICGGVSYGDMIACDNEACPREWFHLHCVGLTKAPAGKAKWYCEECKDELGIPGSGGSGVGAAGQVRRGVGARS